jgi:hypothetical protein
MFWSKSHNERHRGKRPGRNDEVPVTHKTSATANNGLSTTTTPLVVQRILKTNSEPDTGARPSVRLCVGPELARCVHSLYLSRACLWSCPAHLSDLRCSGAGAEVAVGELTLARCDARRKFYSLGRNIAAGHEYC